MGSGRVVAVAAGALLGVAEDVGVLLGAATVLVGARVLEGAGATVATARSNAIGELVKAGASADEHDGTNPARSVASATRVTPFVLTILLA